jgi:hypothetical protein
MSSALALRCQSCNARIKAPFKLLGQVRPCPRCKQPLRIRVQPPEDAGPVILRDQRDVDTGVIPALAHS